MNLNSYLWSTLYELGVHGASSFGASNGHRAAARTQWSDYIPAIFFSVLSNMWPFFPSTESKGPPPGFLSAPQLRKSPWSPALWALLLFALFHHNIGEILQIGAGLAHSCVVMAGSGATYCWGWNAEGQIGQLPSNERVHFILCV